jgi:YidC/Oxa1 family membrane protein insertase
MARPGDRYVIGLRSPELRIGQGEQTTAGLKLYIGPKNQQALEQIAPGLELTVDYGWLWFIAKPLFLLLEWFYGLTLNWGWAIILITLLVKLAFFHLSATSYKSMAKLRKLQPRMAAIRERYGDDRQRAGQAVMELYRQEKVNPMGGCLPIVVQIPVFIALYWVLLESVELRQASFMLWLDDLSTPDPYFVLPLLMGISMYVQQKLSPVPTDPIQQKIFQYLPWIFMLTFALFPSGLVLYWVVSNIVSIAQQWVITRRYGDMAHSAT